MAPIVQTALHYLWFLYGLGFVIAALAIVVIARRGLVPTQSLPFTATALLCCGAALFTTQISWIFPDAPYPQLVLNLLLIACGVLFIEASLRDLSRKKRLRRRITLYTFALPLLALCVVYLHNPTQMSGLHAFPPLFMFFTALALKRSSTHCNIPAASLFILSITGAALIPIAAIPGLTPLHPIAGALFMIVPLITSYILAFSLWHIVAATSSMRITQRPRSQAIILAATSTLCLTIIATAGFLLTWHLEQYARHQQVAAYTERARTIAANLDQAFSSVDDATDLLAGTVEIRMAAVNHSPADLDNANRVLDRFAAVTGNESVAYLIDMTGTTFATSNRKSSDSFYGKNYRIRPYFTQAREGTPGRYCAIGLTSNKRGYYSAFPVRSETGAVCAVAVIKYTLDAPEKILGTRDACMLVDPHGIVFISNRTDRLFKTTRPIADSIRSAIVATHQFGEGHIPELPPPSHSTHPGMRQPLTISTPLASLDNWEIIYEAESLTIVLYRFAGLGLSFFAVLILIGISMIVGESNWLLRKLAASEEQYRNVFEKSSAAMLLLDAETLVIEQANAAAQTLFGTTTLGGRPLSDMVALPPDFFGRVSEPEILSVDICVENAQAPRSTELHYVKVDDSIHVILFDTTQRKKAEAALAANRQRLELALWSEGLSVWDWDITANRVLFDSRWGDMLGHEGYTDTPDDPLRLREIHPDDRLTVTQILDRIRSGVNDTLRHRYRMKTATGKNIWVLNCGRVIERDFSGTPVRVVGILNNITTQVETETHLAEMASRMAAILDTMPHLAWLKDSHGRYLTVNARFAEAAGKPSEEIIGCSDYALWPFALADKYVRDDREVMENRNRKFVEEAISTPQGTLMFETFKSPIISPKGEVTGTAGVSRDITVRKAIEEASRTTGELLQSLGHEIRTQLSNILGMVGIAKKTASVEEINMHLEHIAEAGGSLLAFINERSPAEYSVAGTAPADYTLSIGETIIIADDNPISIKLLTTQLKESGATILAAENGREVLNLLDEHPETALIVLDVIMPIMDGLETTARIRIKEAESDSHIPIIAITARALPGDRKNCLSAGMDDYMPKPVEPEELIGRIRYWLDQKKIS